MSSLPPTPPEILRVTALASDGDGIARLASGRVVFVEGAVPGDLVELAPIREHKKLLRAKIARIVEASSDRVEPRCAHFGECGGCVWQHVRYPVQLEAKRANVRAALERIGGLRLERDVEILASPDAYHYRARTRVVEVPGGVGYRRRASNEVLRIDRCPVLVPALQEALARASANSAGTPSESGARGDRASHDPREPREPREWVITAGTRGPARVERPSETSGPSTAVPDEGVVLEVLGERLRLGGPGFVQGNALLWEDLARAVRDRCLLPVAGRAPKRFVELYAGIGFFAVPLARTGLAGIAVESDARAVADLVANLAGAGLAGSVEAIAAPVERRRELSDWLAGADLLLVDPPRVGLDGGVRETVAKAGPPAVVYVSCDPATLARDLKLLVAHDYRVESVLAFDLFPQTPHVETVVRLTR